MARLEDLTTGTRLTGLVASGSATVGSVKLNRARVGRDAGRIADEVIAHLAALPGAGVEVSLEVQVRVGEGAEEDVVRIVSENATVLKIDHATFEEDCSGGRSSEEHFFVGQQQHRISTNLLIYNFSGRGASPARERHDIGRHESAA